MISAANSFQIVIWWHCPRTMRSVTLLIDSMAGLIVSSLPYLLHNIKAYITFPVYHTMKMLFCLKASH